MRIKTFAVGVILCLVTTTEALDAQDLAAFEKTVTEHTLENGMQFIIVERPEIPVVSFHTYADMGSVDEEAGISGMAHMF